MRLSDPVMIASQPLKAPGMYSEMLSHLIQLDLVLALLS